MNNTPTNRITNTTTDVMVKVVGKLFREEQDRLTEPGRGGGQEESHPPRARGLRQAFRIAVRPGAGRHEADCCRPGPHDRRPGGAVQAIGRTGQGNQPAL
jgi:hypothetical protein